MGGLTGAVHWWEEWQMRVLVLSSLVVQFLLLISSYARRFAIHRWLRFIMWLAYLAGDALAIYALATLFNRHKAEQQDSGGGGGGSTTLEVVWAPILLIHLGGHDGITAYNIEDNELWSRHLVTAVSQVTVAIYVFCKSWPGGDKRLFQAAIVLFVPGVLKCLAKPLALKMASINSLVSSHAAERIAKQNGIEGTLEEYVKQAKDFVRGQNEQGPTASGDGAHPPSNQQGGSGSSQTQDLGRGRQSKEAAQRAKRNERDMALLEEYVKKAKVFAKDEGDAQQVVDDTTTSSSPYHLRRGIRRILRGEAHKLFVDLSSPYPRRLGILQCFWVLSEEKGENAYGHVRHGLASAFFLLYTKVKTASLNPSVIMNHSFESVSEVLPYLFGQMTLLSRFYLSWAAIGLFHHSHREAYSNIDVNITYAIFCCTAVIELYSIAAMKVEDDKSSPLVSDEQWPEMVAQYSFIGYAARNIKPSKMMRIVSFFGCKDFLDQHFWRMSPCQSSSRITQLVLQYLKAGWMTKIQDVASYRRFNNNRGHSAIEGNEHLLGWSIKGPFDESVLLWHIATDLCFSSSNETSDHRCRFAEVPTLTSVFGRSSRKPSSFQGFIIEKLHIKAMVQNIAPAVWGIVQCIRRADRKGEGGRSGCGKLSVCKAIQCRQMSNYMMYLLFVNPEMLLPGTRQSLLTTAYDELEDILEPSLFTATYKEFKDILKDNEPSQLQSAYQELKDILKDIKRNVYKRVTAAIIELRDILRDKERNPLAWSRLRYAPGKEERLVGRVITTMLSKSKRTSEEESKKSFEGEPKEGSKEESKRGSKENFIDDAWALSQELLDLGKHLGQEKMWDVIQGVWVEMLCFSASRCRGYLHAKALGSGGEFLSYVWLLLFCMGAETLTERLQREELPSREGNNAAAAPPASDARNGSGSASSTSKVHTGASPSTVEIDID
ncbi:hypothetical protein BS78_09G060200 [Paspalum vaginatum]|nr:hypothetical protein BS78_09G060200 [Paspalum vaginatum]